MTLDLRFYDINNSELTIDKVTGGYYFGVVRKGSTQVLPVVIKNLGTSEATGLSVKASPLYGSGEVSIDEYNSQVLASTWKTFSFLPDRNFSSTLALPNIKAGGTMKGLKLSTDDMSNAQTSAWKTDTLPNHTFAWTGNSLTCSSPNLSYYARADASGWGQNKDIDFTATFSMPINATSGSAFTFFNLRQNCLGDEKGYLITIKRNTTNNSLFFEVRKGAGLKSTGATDFGTIIAVSSVTNNVPNPATVRIKLFTNSNNLPELKIWVNNIKDTDSSVTWGTTNPTTTWVDTANTYNLAGLVTTIFGSGIGGTFELLDTSLITDDPIGKVYVKTIIGEGAVDQKLYASSMELFYDPVV